jgi:murein tripeptide amidase MpaA
MIVPMVNPDGVYEGNYRMDPSNRNLNRLYLNPTFEN